MDDLFSGPVATARMHAEQFTAEFLAWLPLNIHVYTAFESEALAIARKGFKHYSAYTIVHVLRHHSALRERHGDGWKLNNNQTPMLARLFALLHPAHADLFEYREAKAAKRYHEGAPA